MAASKDKLDTKRVMDVSKPGKSAPDSSSRPIIVGHKPMIADPMVNPEKDESENTEPETVKVKKLTVVGEKVLLPPSQQKNAEKADGSPTSDGPELPKDDIEEPEKTDDSKKKDESEK